MNCVQKSISPCIETLKAVDGKIGHLVWHQARFDKTRRELYGDTSKILLSAILEPPNQGEYRVRIEYTDTILKVEYFPLHVRTFEHFALVETDIHYAYKYANREHLIALKPSIVDDVIFTCKGELRDTSIANIALYSDGCWLTPQTPLLEGTTRERLLRSGFLKGAILTTKHLQKASKFAIMNALIGFKILEKLSIKG